MTIAVDQVPQRVAPETLDAFRLGQLVLLLSVAADARAVPVDIDRLGYYDFFAANPFLVIGEDDPGRVELALVGFEVRNLDYQSSSHRFSNRRGRLQHDLAWLLSRGLAHVAGSRGRVGYLLTDRGMELASRFTALYAQAYQQSASHVIRKLRPLSDARLRKDAKQWLRAESLLIDLYD